MGVRVGLEDEGLGFEGGLNGLRGFEEGGNVFGSEDEDGGGGRGGSG